MMEWVCLCVPLGVRVAIYRWVYVILDLISMTSFSTKTQTKA